MIKQNKRTFNIPTFIGIGAAKCGTTWLSEVLRKHPQIFISHGKEIVYFSSDKNFAKGSHWYLDHFSGANGKNAVGEISVSYLRTGNFTAKRIYDFNPDLKLIAVLRDPVYRSFSHYLWLIQLGKIKNESFTDALNNHPVITRDSLYYQNLTHFWKYFTDDKILIMKYEDIKNSGHNIQRCIYEFLGVDCQYDSGLANKIIGKTIIPKSQLLENMRIRTHAFAMKKNIPFLITVFKQTGLSTLYRNLNDGKKRKITEIEYRHAAELFTNDIRHLKEKSGMNLDSWLKYIS